MKGGFLTTTASIATILSVAGELVTASIKWVGEFIALILGQPLLLVGLVVSLVGFSIGIIKRLMRL